MAFPNRLGPVLLVAWVLGQCYGSGAAFVQYPPSSYYYYYRSSSSRTHSFLIKNNFCKPSLEPTIAHSRPISFLLTRLAAKSDRNDKDKWQKRSKRWDEHIADLRKYNETFGTVNVPYNHFTNGDDEWANLAGWVFSVREKQGRLSEERHAQLTAMGFLWKGANKEKEHQRWEAMFQRLVGHKEVHGDCLVPQKWDIDKPLGQWVMTQRKEKKEGILSRDRATKLDSIGFVWVMREVARSKSRKRDRQWCRMYIWLIRYYREHGNYWVPIDRRNNDNPLNPLGSWVQRQRHLFKKGTKVGLREDRKQRLNKIGFTWDSTKKLEAQWYEKYNQLKEILGKNRIGQQQSVELFIGSVLGEKLYKWVSRQRGLNEKSAIDPKRKALLDEIGFAWSWASDE